MKKARKKTAGSYVLSGDSHKGGVAGASDVAVESRIAGRSEVTGESEEAGASEVAEASEANGARGPIGRKRRRKHQSSAKPV